MPTHPPTDAALGSQVRALIGERLHDEHCSLAGIAARLAIHPRTLQRRLRRQGLCFEAMRDELRRDRALAFLQQDGTPLSNIAEALGYSEPSSLSRSCYRWFAAWPKQLRDGAAAGLSCA